MDGTWSIGEWIVFLLFFVPLIGALWALLIMAVIGFWRLLNSNKRN